MDSIEKELEREFELMEKKADDFYNRVMQDDPVGRISAQFKKLKEELCD